MHKSIITLRHILYLLYFYLCLELSPFMLAHMFFCLFLEYVLLFLDDNLDEECELI